MRIRPKPLCLLGLCLVFCAIPATAETSRQRQVLPDETLWRIATEIRPDLSVSMSQVMQAIRELNPQAFQQGDPNQLRHGIILQLPSREQMMQQNPELAEQVMADARAALLASSVRQSSTITQVDTAELPSKNSRPAVVIAEPQPTWQSEAATATKAPQIVSSSADNTMGVSNHAAPTVAVTEPGPGFWQQVEWFSQLNLMPRWYPQTGLQQQAQWHSSVSFELEGYWQSDDRSHTLVFSPYMRWDQRDSARHLLDISEAYWLYFGGDWELRAGINKVFWGAVESQRLVDVINQRDLLDRPDGESKLGQPMLQLSLIRDYGTVQAYLLPYFRERKFAGEKGRLRLPQPVDTSAALYESRHKRSHLDWALRWSQQFSSLDLGLSYFQGTAREPVLLPTEQSLLPFYPQLKQLGLDAQWVLGSWLWKTEAVYRHTEQEHSKALVTGFEYTQVGINDHFWDLGWLLEYQYDSRGLGAATIAQNDVFVGWRLALNDAAGSEILFGMMQDLDRSHSRSAYLEASTRLGERLRLRVDGWLFHSRYPDELLYWLRRDDYIQLTLEYYF
ncbi:FimV/HubP family polar landmark protein [Alkalimonas sp. MEB108]|uniref:FimV/HubP family polar landmark protein n=1 Tax=Alkalimonas cellulosilytica TaxID=3058395 RepID=A0ABU7J8U4_9GAMM|nr:FimV/HubP family polar landmark protein [Alkalimonas sp. MEB108]MEE2002966.1 FimV/HubP family polar landmark protein [Alkalimonas sp. MEB108]